MGKFLNCLIEIRSRLQTERLSAQMPCRPLEGNMQALTLSS